MVLDEVRRRFPQWTSRLGEDHFIDMGVLGQISETSLTRDVVTCDPDDSIDQVMGTMTRGRFRHLPVVRHGELLGLVSIGDVVKARLEEAEHETEALKAYIVAG